MIHGPKHLKDFDVKAAMKTWATSTKGTLHMRAGLEINAGPIARCDLNSWLASYNLCIQHTDWLPGIFVT